ncbi:MAG: nucleotidyltransferase, partial [Deltaproteobacteria bacterium]|nr:nucleotidyltransferase [Deltaproteobacteria bacterium]
QRDFQLKTQVDQVPIDILWADPYVGQEVVLRAVAKPLAKHWVRVATPEDLIILKTLANRSIDRRDIEELRELFSRKLDEAYIQKKLQQVQKEK